VVVDNGVHIILRDLVEHLFADNPGQSTANRPYKLLFGPVHGTCSGRAIICP
jgi:hypothetical protein